LALFLVFAVIAGSFTAWYLFTRPPPLRVVTGRMAQAFNDRVALIMSVDKAEFGLGETVNVTFTIRNLWEGDISLVWDSHLILDFVVYGESFKKICAWSWGRYFYDIPRTINLHEGEPYEEILSWDQKILDGVTGNFTQVDPGVYYLEGILVKGFSHEELRTPLLRITIPP